MMVCDGCKEACSHSTSLKAEPQHLPVQQTASKNASRRVLPSPLWSMLNCYFFLPFLLLLLFNISNSLEVSTTISPGWEADGWGCQQERGTEDGGNKDKMPSFQFFLPHCGGTYRQPKNKEEPPQAYSI